MLAWRGFYLGPNTVLDQDALAAAAVPAYTREHRHDPAGRLDASHGKLDAELACFSARIAGFRNGTIVYLDLRDELDYSAEYIHAWVETVKAFSFTPGMCGREAVITELDVKLAGWVFCTDRDGAREVSRTG